MKKNIKRILILPLIICLLFSSLCLYSCSDQPVTKWHYGEEKPGKSLVANVGDCYLEYESCDVYTYTEDGWELSFNMKGEDGKNGKNGKDGQNGKNGVKWLSGEQKPDVLLGKNGDRYLWTKNMTVYEKKNGKWNYQMNFSSQRVYDYSNDSDGELKILCIGNSFSIDTMQYVYQILQDLGIQNVTLGNIHKPGCPVGTHYTNIKEDNAAYTFYYNDNGKWKPTGNYTIKQALLLEDWDFISFQQKSGYSGKPNSDYFANLQPLADEVRKIEPNATFLWNMTWAYQEGYKGLETNDYGTQMVMYDGIVETVKSIILPNPTFEFVSPTGTAIQNARTSYLGDTLNRDGIHLSYGLGRYIAALTFVGAITGMDISGVTWRPENVSEDEQKIAIESAVNALENPYSITESQYK